MIRSTVLALAALGCLAGPAAAQDDFQPAIIFDMGGKFDKSFNEAAYTGAERYKESTGTEYLEFEITNESQREQALERMARRGADVVVAVGFAFAQPLETVAPNYPDTQFVIIDSVVEADNVKSIVFKEEEGSFLAGIAAANASETGKVGFVGGMDIPLIRKFQAGYEAGARHANPEIETYANMTGTTPAAWNDPTKGGELARSQFDRGVDVVYAAAGATGLGVLQAAADADKLAIGVDSNQNYLHPGTMLTSMVKGVDVAVFNAFEEAAKGTLATGVVDELGLAEEGVGVAVDEHNADLIDEATLKAIDEARQGIVAGEIDVPSEPQG